MVMEKPSPPCVGREFVKQYYTMLNQAPGFLHRFYSHDSSFLHSGFTESDEDLQVVTGQSDIHKKIMSLGFHDCHAKIHQVDSQATIGDGVVVQVVGELSNDGAALRRFVQTFVLAAQSAKKYYVHNDIFRYQDDIFRDSVTSSTSAVCFAEQQQQQQQQQLFHIAEENHHSFTGMGGHNGNGGMEPVPEDGTHGSVQMVPVSRYEPIVIQPQSLSSVPSALEKDFSDDQTNGIDHTVNEYVENRADDPLLQPPAAEPIHLASPAAEPADVAESLAVSEEPTTCEEKPAVTSLEAEISTLENEEPASHELSHEPISHELKHEPTEPAEKIVEPDQDQEGRSQRPMTWAAMASKTPPSAAATSQCTTHSAPQPARTVRVHPTGVRTAQHHEQKTSDTASAAAAEHKTSSAFQHRTPRSSLGGSSQDSAAADHAGGDGIAAGRSSVDDESRRFTTPQHIYPDSQQIFVGNLPQYLTDKELREFFEQYGPIVEMKINRKSINVNNLPNFGFIVFENAEIVQTILDSRPLYLTGVNGRHRVNVEEKKSRTELSASRPRSAPRGGMRPGYGRGADSYGRGGGPRPYHNYSPAAGNSAAAANPSETVQNSGGTEESSAAAPED